MCWDWMDPALDVVTLVTVDKDLEIWGLIEPILLQGSGFLSSLPRDTAVGRWCLATFGHRDWGQSP